MNYFPISALGCKRAKRYQCAFKLVVRKLRKNEMTIKKKDKRTNSTIQHTKRKVKIEHITELAIKSK